MYVCMYVQEIPLILVRLVLLWFLELVVAEKVDINGSAW